MNPLKTLSAAALSVSLLLSASGASACTTLYVGGNLTEEGTPFVARTEDYGSDMNKLWFISEAGAFKAGDSWRGCPAYGEFEWTFRRNSYCFTYFTNDILNGACPECGEENPTHFSYTEFGTNEMGVSVSATESISGNEQVKAVDPNVQTKTDGRVGIEETDIPTILLAEASSAREGVELLGEIYTDYGAYFDSGLFICDQNEVWYVENCSGTQYAAVKLNNDLLFIEPNIAVIGLIDLDDTENVIASPRLIEVAQQAGTFVGDAQANQIDFRASYANLGTAEAPRVGAPRMVDGLNFLNVNADASEGALAADQTRFTISNVKDGEIVPLYSSITADRTLTKNDVFDFYKLSSVGKPSNQEIEIFQLFADRPVETGTVGWVGVGNMAYNVFIPYYPLLMQEIYAGYQVSTPVVTKVPLSEGRPEGFATYAQNRRTGEEFYVVYPENWRDSYYFAFEGLGGSILYAEQLTGAPIAESEKQLATDTLAALQDEINAGFESLDPNETGAFGKQMAEKAQQTALTLIDRLTAQ